jgi:GTPase SAR1 family protein
MSLLKAPEMEKRALKVLCFGDTGTGKTLFALSFPKNVITDSEDGYAFYKNNPNIALMATTNSIYDLEEILDEVEELIEKNEISTFTTDSITKFYANLQYVYQDLVEKRARRKGQDVDDAGLSQREWAKIKTTLKRINDTKLMMSSKGTNIVDVAQQKDIKEKRGDTFVKVGVEPDYVKNSNYDYDIIINMYTEEDKKTGETHYYGKILKDRTQKYKKNEVIENPSFKNWEDVYNGYSNAKESVVDFRADYTKDTSKTESNEATATDLANKIKDFIKNASAEQKATIAKAMKSLNNIKDLSSNPIEDLQAIVDLINTLS